MSLLPTASFDFASQFVYTEALAIDEALVRRDPVNVTWLFNLGGKQRAVGRLDAAIASYRTALSLPRAGATRTPKSAMRCC